MMIAPSIFVFISYLFCLTTAQDSELSNDTLVMTHVLFRHGDRNPLPKAIYPTDPWKDPSNWPEGLGVNTKLGLRQSYALGQYLRERYQTILGNDKFSESLVHVQSTDYPRTLNSAGAVVAGMFPPKADEMFDPDIKWYPIPIHSAPLNLDHVLYGGRPCERFQYAYDKYHASDEYKKEFDQFKPLIEYLEKHSGIQIHHFKQINRLYDALWVENLKNKTLPKWTESVFGPGTDFEWAFDRYFRTYSMTSEIFRYTYGYLIREIFDHFTKKIEGTLSPNRTVFLYSAHDTNIVAILHIFGLFAPFGYRQPPYASSLHFDLYKTKDNQYYMQLTYRQNNEANLLKFPECGINCAMEDLRRMYNELLPTTDFEEECRLPFHIRIMEGYSIFGPDDGIIIAITIAITTLITLSITWLFFSLKNDKNCLKTISKKIKITKV